MNIPIDLSNYSLETQVRVVREEKDEKLLSIMAKSEKIDVRKAVAENKNTSEADLTDLLYDDIWEVAEAALLSLRLKKG